MFILRSYAGIQLAAFGSAVLALQAAAAGTCNRNYVCEVWHRSYGPGHDEWVEDLVVTYRGPVVNPFTR